MCVKQLFCSAVLKMILALCGSYFNNGIRLRTMSGRLIVPLIRQSFRLTNKLYGT